MKLPDKMMELWIPLKRQNNNSVQINKIKNKKKNQKLKKLKSFLKKLRVQSKRKDLKYLRMKSFT